ncbi:GumC family protein [Sphingobium sp. TKS]|uniref:GumC family protein n=1 Tax=Sphingobium sp. TKS TaxID=1315974 RepID=UPI00076FF78A|nr:polysaccharide biosynthesis tyrosine autokinase [Sphingobium sp. TKS]AMK26090.1 non-specific protein-tyrosine kinase [Sphingobium sp. TKS]
MSTNPAMKNSNQDLLIAGDAKATPSVDRDTFSLAQLLTRYWQAVVRWRLLIAGLVAGAVIIGLVVTLLMAPLYTARSQIEVSRERKNVTNVEGLDSAGEGRDVEFYATQYALLKAESLSERVVRELGLAETSEFFEAHGKKPAELIGFPDNSPETKKARVRQAVALLQQNLDISPIRGSRLIDIKYTSRKPEISARIANEWAQQFISSTMDRQFAATADARKFLETRLAQLRHKLEQSERDVVSYANNKGIVTLDATRDPEGRTFTQRTLASANLEALNQALTQAEAERIAAESRANGSAENSPEVLTNQAIVDLRARRAQAAAEYAKLILQYEPKYPAARALKAQMATLDAAIAREVERISGSRKLAFTEALKREQDLRAKVEALKQVLNDQRQASIQQNIYQRDADTNRQLYDALLQRYKEIGVAGTVGASNIVIVDAAKVPQSPSAPNLMLNIALATLAGIALSAAAVFGLEQIDEGIREPGEVRTALGTALLGHVPLGEEATIAEISDPKSELAEAYFSIRSSLAFATNHGLPRTIAVTSTKRGEGKSTGSLALATVIGRTGKRVLLIDGDMRSPTLHRHFGTDHKEGLSNLLAGEPLLDQVKATGERGLSVLTAGPIPPSPAELLSSDMFREIIARFLESYDHIIVDTPPVLGLADAPLIGRQVEGVIYVVESASTSRRAAQAALQRLEAVNAHLFGAIVNKVDYSKHGYGYGYGYGYAYGRTAEVGEAG